MACCSRCDRLLWDPWATLSLVLFLVAPPSALAQDQPIEQPVPEPWGSYVQATLSTMGGNGLQVGIANVRTVYIREVLVLADLDPLFRDTDRRSRVVLLPGVSVRLFGFERLIGGAAYRGFDIDLGLRAGPGLAFDTEETSAEKDRRFELVVEPFVRLTTAQSRNVAWLLELGSTRPALRFGVWIRY